MTAVDPHPVIDRFYPPGGLARRILLAHGRQVADKALEVARRLQDADVDWDFLESAALLHDIGMIGTRVPELGCHGDAPYIRHGVIGREMLESAGLPRHALVCERHVGVGLGPEDIRAQRLPLPERDMRPVSLEEQIVCYADKFFSKRPDGAPAPEKSPRKIAEALARYGPAPAQRFADWHRRFGGDT